MLGIILIPTIVRSTFKNSNHLMKSILFRKGEKDLILALLASTASEERLELRIVPRGELVTAHVCNQQFETYAEDGESLLKVTSRILTEHTEEIITLTGIIPRKALFYMVPNDDWSMTYNEI